MAWISMLLTLCFHRKVQIFKKYVIFITKLQTNAFEIFIEIVPIGTGTLVRPDCVVASIFAHMCILVCTFVDISILISYNAFFFLSKPWHNPVALSLLYPSGQSLNVTAISFSLLSKFDKFHHHYNNSKGYYRSKMITSC